MLAFGNGFGDVSVPVGADAQLARTSEARLHVGDLSLYPLKRLHQFDVLFSALFLHEPRGDRCREQRQEADADEHQDDSDQPRPPGLE